jgi:hypothetical protein
MKRTLLHLSAQAFASGFFRTVGVALIIGGCLLQAAQAAPQVSISDPADMGDSSGDIRNIGAYVRGDILFLTMQVEGVAAPSVEQTPEGMNNRYYYHWLLDTDNNPATGRSNAEYEGQPTGVTKPIGTERVIMIGWRNGKPNGLEIYDPLDEDNPIATGFTYFASGNTLTAAVPLTTLGLSHGQTIAISGFQEGSSEGWKVDWVESAELTIEAPQGSVKTVTDPADMGDSSGDIRNIGAYALGEHLFLWMTVEGIAAPSVANTPEGMSNRYYYHWLLDTDNNPATGRSNSEYEGNPTGVAKPIGTERVIMVGWRNGKPNGVKVYDPLDEDTVLLSDFPFQAGGNTLMAMVPFSTLGLSPGQTVALSAFQEGASEGWKVDWVESVEMTMDGPATPIAVIEDPADMGDSSGDIRRVSAWVQNESLHLSMTVRGVAAPSVENTPEGMSNRYYYHWLLDTDNNPATGRSNAEYEGNPTGVSNPIGTERVVMIGWRNGKPNGLEVYDPLDEDNPILSRFEYQASGNTLTAVIPLADLGLTRGQTIALSAFQEGASEGWKVDWVESASLTLETGESSGAPVVSVDDPQDMGDSSGDIKRIEATIQNGNLVLRMWVYGVIMPSMDETPDGMVNRYYYHWLLDTDNNPATGRSNAEYEGNPTGVSRPIGTERVIMIGWRNGALNGLKVYDPLDEDTVLISDFNYEKSGDMVEVKLPLASLGLTMGQTIAFSAFQEGASEGWKVDWVESAELTLSEGDLPTLSLATVFTGSAYGFEIQLTDDGPAQANPATVQVLLDGTSAIAQANKTGGVTTISGTHPSLLPPNTKHTLELSLEVGGEVQSRTFIFDVGPYTVLPSAGRLATLDQSNKGFLVYTTAISSWQTGVPSLHSNMVEYAEMQLSGQLTEETTGAPWFNDMNPDGTGPWKGMGTVVEGVINWFELAPESDASLNFPNDEPIPNMVWGVSEGLVVEILTYLELPQGAHKLGLYSEGGHKVTAGLSPSSPLISVWDNTEVENRIPTYFGRNQFLDVVAPEAGYYPVRILWFQSRRRQEPGLMLEFFSVKGRDMHLVNQTGNADSIKAFRAGVLLTPGVELPTLVMSRNGANLTFQYTGRLEAANTINGPWTVIGQPAQSPVTVQTTGTARFFRSRND